MNKKVDTKFRKVTINVPTRVWLDLEARRKENGTTITNEILNLVRFGLKQEQVIDTLPNLINALNEQKPTKKIKK